MAAAPPLPEQRRWLFIYTLFHGHRPAWPVIVGPPELPEKTNEPQEQKKPPRPRVRSAPKEKRNKGKTKEKVQSKGGPALPPPPHYPPPYHPVVLSLLQCTRLSSCARTLTPLLSLSPPAAAQPRECVGVSIRTPSLSLATVACAVGPTPDTW